SRMRKGGFKVIEYGAVSATHIPHLTLRRGIAGQRRAPPSSHIIYTKLSRINGYFSSYVSSRWWSMLQVFKASPSTQLLEYLFYGCFPPVFLTLLMTNPLYAVVLLGTAVVSIEFAHITRGYYRAYSAKRRMLYPLVIVAVRTFRTYSFLVGLLLSKGRPPSQSGRLEPSGILDHHFTSRAVRQTSGDPQHWL